MNKKIKYTLLGITFLILVISVFFYNTLTSYSEISINKAKEVMNEQQNWVDEMIQNSDTTSYSTKRRIDSIAKGELQILKKQDSLLRLEMKIPENKQ